MHIPKSFAKFLSFFVAFTFFGFAQEYPPIVKYSQSVYLAGIQNWMIAQDANHFLFFANKYKTFNAINNNFILVWHNTNLHN